MKYLESVLDEIFGALSCQEKDLIIEAVKKDNKDSSGTSGKTAEIMDMFNRTFNKKSRVMSQKVVNKYKMILKVFSLEDIQKAFDNAKANDYHIETNHLYCTLEYFSRIEQMDKWVSFDPKQTSMFKTPEFNLKK